MYSKATQAAVVTTVSSRAFTPKISVLAMTQGIREITTLPISLRVLTLSVIWGEAVTIRLSIYLFPPILWNTLAMAMVWVRGRLAGHTKLQVPQVTHRPRFSLSRASRS